MNATIALDQCFRELVCRKGNGGGKGGGTVEAVKKRQTNSSIYTRLYAALYLGCEIRWGRQSQHDLIANSLFTVQLVDFHRSSKIENRK